MKWFALLGLLLFLGLILTPNLYGQNQTKTFQSSPLFSNRLHRLIPSKEINYWETTDISRTNDDKELTQYDVNITLEGTKGDNNWYVSPVNITFIYNVSEITTLYYRIGNQSFINYTVTFQIDVDRIHSVEWFIVDIYGNISDIQSFEVKIDQTSPVIDLTWESEGMRFLGVGTIIMTATVEDKTSGVNYSILTMSGDKVFSIKDNTTPYEGRFIIPLPEYNLRFQGIILRRKFTETNVSFYAVKVYVSNRKSFSFSAQAYDNAGNHAWDSITSLYKNPPIYYFRWFTFPNDYIGDIGFFKIGAQFTYGPIETHFGGLFK